jgi:adenylyltransferase/sulfurtransferase
MIGHTFQPHQPPTTAPALNWVTLLPSLKMVVAINALRQQIAACEDTLQDLRQQLAEAEHNQRQQEKVLRQKPPLSHDPLDHDMNFGVPDDFRSEVFAVLEQDHATREATNSIAKERRWPLEKNEYKRYGRQLIMPEVGLQGTFVYPTNTDVQTCTKKDG